MAERRFGWGPLIILGNDLRLGFPQQIKHVKVTRPFGQVGFVEVAMLDLEDLDNVVPLLVADPIA